MFVFNVFFSVYCSNEDSKIEIEDFIIDYLQ